MEAHCHSSNSRERYEVFRRAIADQDSDAWADVVALYRPLLISWARQRLATMPIEENCADLADEAFARAWSALASSSFDRFANLAAVLGYLRACVASVVVDRARGQDDRTDALTGLEPAAQPSPEQAVLADLRRAEIWARVKRNIFTEQERVVMHESMVLNQPPRAILRRHPGLFDSVATIYALKRNLFDRLRRDDYLRQLCEE